MNTIEMIGFSLATFLLVCCAWVVAGDCEATREITQVIHYSDCAASASGSDSKE